MKTETLTPEQIEAQAQTIENLTKTVERLERELQKCLNPGSDLHSAVKPIGLTREILSERLYNVINAAFIETRGAYNAHSKEHDLNYLPWWYFRNDLFNEEVFSGHWSNPDFRTGVEMLNDICQATEDFRGDVNHFDRFEMAYRLFYSGDDASLRRGLQQLISALTTIIMVGDSGRIDVDTKELLSMMSVLKVIESCQIIWAGAIKEINE